MHANFIRALDRPVIVETLEQFGRIQRAPSVPAGPPSGPRIATRPNFAQCADALVSSSMAIKSTDEVQRPSGKEAGLCQNHWGDKQQFWSGTRRIH